jgi:NAD(P)-dependent dehydrogenase (short-subunit alcohol dehydrogenase family)
MAVVPQHDRWRLDRKTALVTGASSGIGSSIAVSLAEAGAQLAITGRDAARLAHIADVIRREGVTCLEVVADLTSRDGPGRIVDRVIGAFGSIDCLVHSAGAYVVKSVMATTESDFEGQYALHVRAPFLLTQRALPHMSQGSAIVFVTSNLATRGLEKTLAYSVSKAAEEAMARTLGVELAPSGIRVNAVSPGVIRTPMTTNLTKDQAAAAGLLAMTPIRHFGEAHDIAAAVRYLCCDASAFVVATTLVADGGRNSC